MFSVIQYLNAKYIKSQLFDELASENEIDESICSHRVAGYLERERIIERDEDDRMDAGGRAENSHLSLEEGDEDPMPQVLGCSVSYRIAIGPQQGRKVFTMQTIPAREDDECFVQVAKESGFSLHVGVAAEAWERQKLERLCRYISRPAVSEKRLSLTSSGNIRYQLKTPYSDGATHIVFEPLDFMSHIPVLHLRATLVVQIGFPDNLSSQNRRRWCPGQG